MFGLQASDILGIAVVVLILFGPSRLPELARGIGKGMREFKNAVKDEAHSRSAEAKEPAKVELGEPVPAQESSPKV